jgi:hypothetical protein
MHFCGTWIIVVHIQKNKNILPPFPSIKHFDKPIKGSKRSCKKEQRKCIRTPTTRRTIKLQYQWIIAASLQFSVVEEKSICRGNGFFYHGREFWCCGNVIFGQGIEKYFCLPCYIYNYRLNYTPNFVMLQVLLG